MVVLVHIQYLCGFWGPLPGTEWNQNYKTALNREVSELFCSFGCLVVLVVLVALGSILFTQFCARLFIRKSYNPRSVRIILLLL